MAPTKFGLFKSRSREQPEQPSTENLLETTNEPETRKAPDSPIPSTSKGFTGHDEYIPAAIFSILHIDDDDDDDDDDFICEPKRPSPPASPCKTEEELVDYEQLQNQSSGTSMSTLEDLDQISQLHDDTPTMVMEDDASTTHDVNSLQFDGSSVAESEDLSAYCALMKKPKKSKSKETQLTDTAMWQASNVEVMDNLLNRKMSLDEQIKWEAIANARGLCTLTDTCSCCDCQKSKFLVPGIADGDAGMGAAPLITALNFGCQVQ